MRSPANRLTPSPSSAKYGPVFRLNLATNHLTFVTSAPAVAAVYKATGPLRFSEIRKEMSKSIFAIEQEYGDEFFPIMHQMTATPNMAGPTRTLVRRIERELAQIKTGTIGLKEFAIKGMYSESSLLALWLARSTNS